MEDLEKSQKKSQNYPLLDSGKKKLKYSCEACDYNTSNKTDFRKHISTPKHDSKWIVLFSGKITENEIKSRRIILLGHSVGGNIARLVARDILVGNFVHSVLTISTPHKGTILADFALFLISLRLNLESALIVINVDDFCAPKANSASPSL